MEAFDPILHLIRAFGLNQDEADILTEVIRSGKISGVLTPSLLSLMEFSEGGGYFLKPRIADFLSNPDRVPDIRGAKLFYPELGIDGLFFHAEAVEPVSRLMRFALKNAPRNPHMICIHGPDGSGKRSLVKCAANDAGATVLFVDAAVQDRLDNMLPELKMESLLIGAILCFTGFEGGREKLQAIFDGIYPAAGLILFTGEKPLPYIEDVLVLNLSSPIFEREAERKLFDAVAASFPLEQDLDVYADISGFTPLQMRSILQKSLTAAVGGGRDEIDRAALLDSCREIRAESLADSGEVIKPTFVWDDLILPEEQKETLLSAINRIRLYDRVYKEWGFEKKLPYGSGLHILLAGPPGTGKTMTAGIIARELNLPLLRIDLSSIFSKYIGETEKNLARVFDIASKANCVMFFDEADSLFGKRTETKDSHDRYANLQVSFLLQKIEQHKGVTVLSTNLLKNFDPAFLRRFHYVINFPAPGKEERLKLWRNAFPPETPLNGSVDFDFLAESFALTGGGIKNAALSAAFYAAVQNGVISMEHILKSVREECEKTGVPINLDIIKIWQE